MKKKFSFLLLLGIVLISLTTACSKKNSKPKNNPEPSASSLINANFKTSFANGHFTQSLFECYLELPSHCADLVDHKLGSK